MMLGLLIRLHLLLGAIGGFLLAVFCLPAVQTAAVIATYHVVTSVRFNLLAHYQTAAGRLLVVSVIVVAARASTFSVISESRRNHWSRVFSGALDHQEAERADERWGRSNDDKATVNLAVITIISTILAMLCQNTHDCDFNFIAVATAATMWILVRNRWTGLIATGAIFLLCRYKEIGFEYLEEVIPDIGGTFHTLPFPLLVSVSVYLPLVIWAGFRRGSETLCASILVSNAFNLSEEFKLDDSNWWTWRLISLSLMLISVNTAAIKNLKVPGRRRNSWTFFILTILLISSAYFANTKRIGEEAKNDNITKNVPLAWEDFSAACPQEEPLQVVHQAACRQTFANSYVEWEGTVVSVQVLPKVKHTLSELVSILASHMRKECSCNSEPERLWQQLCCHITESVPVQDVLAHDCLVKMQSGHSPSSLFAREPSHCLVDVAMNSDLWGSCLQLQSRMEIEVTGRLVGIFCPVVEADSVQIKMQ